MVGLPGPSRGTPEHAPRKLSPKKVPLKLIGVLTANLAARGQARDPGNSPLSSASRGRSDRLEAIVDSIRSVVTMSPVRRKDVFGQWRGDGGQLTHEPYEQVIDREDSG